MAITFVGGNTTTFNCASGNLDIWVDPTQADDILIVHLASDDNVDFTPPVGWTLITETNNGAGQRLSVYWFRATGDHSASPFTFTRTGGSTAVGKISNWRGCLNSGNVINAFNVSVNASDDSIEFPAIAPSVANCMILAVSTTLGGTTISTVSGTNPTFAERYDNWWGNNTIALSSGIKTDTGTTGGRVATSSVAGLSIGCLIALSPPPPPTAPSGLTATCVMPPFPEASFLASPSSGDAPLAVTFTDTSFGMPTAWLWEFGDGATSVSHNPNHTYTAPGFYTVRLTASNTRGESTIEKPLLVTDALTGPDGSNLELQAVPPIAKFSASVMLGAAPLTVNFTNESLGSPTSWAWDFGDGHISALQNPSNIYASNGQYVVIFTVSDAQGRSSTAAKVIVVSSDPDPADNPPTATIVAGASVVWGSGAINFSAVVSTPDVFYDWDFGDGSPHSDAAAPSHIYSTVGTFTVSLTVRNIYGQTTARITVAIANITQLGRSKSAFYLVDKGNDRVLVYDANGNYNGYFGGRGSSPGKLIGPTQLAVVRPLLGD